MTKVLLEIEDCSQCPFHYSSPYPTDDSFERPEYWWCSNPNVEKEVQSPDPDSEKRRLFYKGHWDCKKFSYVAGYVEWNDKIKIPDWCPIKVKE